MHEKGTKTVHWPTKNAGSWVINQKSKEKQYLCDLYLDQILL